MRKSSNRNMLFIFILLIGATFFNCTVSDSESAAGATVTINLTPPAGMNVSGKTWEIVFTTDLTNLSAGNFDYYTTGTCSSGTTVTITLTDVDPGTYYLFATIYMGTIGTGGPQAGDCVGAYGATNPEDLTTPNAAVPASGTATFNLTLYEMDDNWEIPGDLILSGNLILPAAANGKEWSVYLDTDYDYSNGCVADEYGMCENSTTVPYGINSAPAGTYHLYAVVHVVGTPGGDPVPGDYYGSVASVTIPSTGSVIQNITLSVSTGMEQ